MAAGPGVVLDAGSRLRAGRHLLLCAVWIVASLFTGYQQILDLEPPLRSVTQRCAQHLRRNMLVLALHAMACVAGFIAGSSLPLQAKHHHGVSRWVHEHGGRIAIGFVIAATTFSLSAQAYVLGHTLAGVSGFLRVRPACCCWAYFPMRSSS